MSKITNFLKSLGDSADEVAENLRKKGIKGRRNDAKYCPVIQAIYQQFPNLKRGLILQVTGQPPWFGRVKWNDDGQSFDPFVSPAVINFAGEFDSGKYSDLEF